MYVGKIEKVLVRDDEYLKTKNYFLTITLPLA